MNIKEAKEQIKNAMTAYFTKDEFGSYAVPVEKQRPVFLMGPPGIGKTAIMEQIAQELDVCLVSYSMTHHTRQSALGLPFIEKKVFNRKEYQVSEYTMSEIIASVYETMEATGKKEGILFLDEINCVSETLAPSMLQFLQYKIFGRHRVPEGWIVVTAGNPPEYNRSVREFDIVTWDRLKRIDVEPDFDAWKEFAYQKHVHPAVMTYLEIRKGDFYKVESTVNGKRFVTARGWDDLSQMIHLYEQNHLPVDEKLIIQYLQNPKIAKEFAVYYDLFNKYRSDYQVDKILAGKATKAIRQRASAAKFDERLSLLGLLLDAATGELRSVVEREEMHPEGRESRPDRAGGGSRRSAGGTAAPSEDPHRHRQAVWQSLPGGGALSPPDHRRSGAAESPGWTDRGQSDGLCCSEGGLRPDGPGPESPGQDRRGDAEQPLRLLRGGVPGGAGAADPGDGADHQLLRRHLHQPLRLRRVFHPQPGAAVLRAPAGDHLPAGVPGAELTAGGEEGLMYRIFIVEDDAAIAGVIRRHLEGWGYTVRCAERFDDVLSEFAAFDPHLVLLDVSLPFFNGYHWCQEIRRVSKAPILFLTSASDNVNVVMAMQLGGDDLLAKPFDLQVLSAKVQALLRRAYDFGPSSHLLSCGAAVLNVSDGTLDAHGQRVELTRNECRILQLLLEHKGEIVSRDALMTRLWESDSFVDENTLTVNIARLRRKLEAAGLPDFIRTRKGAGYLVEG